jgi:hypothetical protein
VENLTLPEGLETISDGAFDHMSGLTNTKITIPASVTTIGGNYNVTQNTGYGGHIFYDMGKNDTFKEFEVADGNEYFTAVDGVLYSKDMTRMLAYPRGKTDEKFEIPEGITQIDEMAFSRAAYLKTVVLPDSYTIITDIPSNILNQEGNSLSIGLYVYTSVNYVDVKDSNEKYVSIDGVIYSKDKKTLWYVPNQKSGKIDIQDGCEKIEKGGLYAASMSNTGWTAINVPASVTDIDTDVFDELNSYFAGYVTVDNNKYYKINTEKCSYELFDNNKQLAAVLLKHLSGIKQENVSKQFETADLRDVIALLKEENE